MTSKHYTAILNLMIFFEQLKNLCEIDISLPIFNLTFSGIRRFVHLFCFRTEGRDSRKLHENDRKSTFKNWFERSGV